MQETVIEDALTRAGGDCGLALDLLARDVVGFTYTIEDLEHAKGLLEGDLEFKDRQLKAAEPGFLTKLSNSTAFKVGIFVLGAYIGQEMVKVR